VKRFRLPILVLGLALLGGCVAPAEDASSVTSTTATVARSPDPKVGECRGPITREIIRASSDIRRPLSCDQPHGSETVFVGQLPPAVSSLSHRDVDQLAADSEALRPILDECDEAYEGYVGVSRISPDSVRVTNLSRAFFVPSADDWAQGARWLRCDAVTEPVNGQVNRESTEPLRGILNQDPLPAKWRACYRDVTPPPQLRFDFFTSCDQPHAGEALLRFDVNDPVLDEMAKRGALDQYARSGFDQACTDRVAGLVGVPAADLASRTDITVGIVVPQLARWADDPKARWVQCLAFTSRPTGGTLEGLGAAPLPRP
jgi:hypothetical protein